jgi:hypothetical protein
VGPRATRRRLGHHLVGGFWPALAQWVFIGGSLLVILSLFFLGRRFRDSEADRDIRKLYGDH